MCDPVTIGIGSLLLGAVSAGSQYVQGQKAAKSQDAANKTAEANAAKTRAMAEQQINQANQRSPNTQAIQSGQQMQAQAGGGGATMLTGPQGVDPKSLTLGKNTLLGQ